MNKSPQVWWWGSKQAKLLFRAASCMVYGVGWFPTAVRIRLSQPPAGDWLAGAWAELGNEMKCGKFDLRMHLKCWFVLEYDKIKMWCDNCNGTNGTMQMKRDKFDAMNVMFEIKCTKCHAFNVFNPSPIRSGTLLVRQKMLDLKKSGPRNLGANKILVQKNFKTKICC